MKVEKIRFLGSLLNIGDEISITIKTPKFKGVYKANVENVDENYIYVNAPFMNGEPVFIPHGSEVEGTFINKYGKFIIRTKVSNKNNGVKRVLTINIPKYMYHIQMRSFFRIELKERVDVKTIAVLHKDNNIMFRIQQKRGMLIDLSGSGAKITVEVSLNVHQIIELLLDNVITDISPVIGEVVKIYEGKGGVSYGIHFLSIKEKDRDKIVKFGLREQSKTSKLH